MAPFAMRARQTTALRVPCARSVRTRAGKINQDIRQDVGTVSNTLNVGKGGDCTKSVSPFLRAP